MWSDGRERRAVTIARQLIEARSFSTFSWRNAPTACHGNQEGDARRQFGVGLSLSMRRHRAKKPPESVEWGSEALPQHERLKPQSDPSGARRSRREFQVGPSEASIPIQDRLIPWVNLTDVDLIPLGRVSLLR